MKVEENQVFSEVRPGTGLERIKRLVEPYLGEISKNAQTLPRGANIEPSAAMLEIGKFFDEVSRVFSRSRKSLPSENEAKMMLERVQQTERAAQSLSCSFLWRMTEDRYTEIKRNSSLAKNFVAAAQYIAFLPASLRAVDSYLHSWSQGARSKDFASSIFLATVGPNSKEDVSSVLALWNQNSLDGQELPTRPKKK